MLQKSNTKERILEKAKEIIARRGLSGLKTDELAREVGISKRTLYEYFSSKKKLFENIVDNALFKHLENIKRILADITRDDDSDFMNGMARLSSEHLEVSRTFTIEFIKDAEKYYPDLFNKLKYFRNEELMESYRQISELGKKRGYLIEEHNQKMIYFIHLIVLDYLIAPDIIVQLPMSLEEVISSIYNILMMGLLTDKGREEYKKSTTKSL